MSIRGQNSQKARVRAAKIDKAREKAILMLALLGGGALIAAATLTKLLLISP